MAYVLGHRLDYEKWFPDFAGKNLYNNLFSNEFRRKRDIFIYTLIFFIYMNIIESVAKNDESISISDLRWTTDFADVILNAIKELNHNISNINLQLDIGI